LTADEGVFYPRRGWGERETENASRIGPSADLAHESKTRKRGDIPRKYACYFRKKKPTMSRYEGRRGPKRGGEKIAKL